MTNVFPELKRNRKLKRTFISNTLTNVLLRYSTMNNDIALKKMKIGNMTKDNRSDG